MVHYDEPWESPGLQQLIDSLFTPAAQKALQSTGFPFKLPDGSISFDDADTMEAIFEEIFRVGEMTNTEYACFRLLRVRFRHECELLLLHIMARQGVYFLPDDGPGGRPSTASQAPGEQPPRP
jgi:hypothetical protein